MGSAQFDDKKVYKGKCTLGYLVALYSGCFTSQSNMQCIYVYFGIIYDVL